MLKKNIFKVALIGCLALGAAACNDGDLDPNSIFSTENEELDPTSSTYQLDKFCEDSIRAKYNMEFRFKMKDVSSDMNYNLVPATYQNSLDLAVLTKYFWLDVYDKVVPDKTFLKQYAPRVLQLIGSLAINTTNHTVKLGYAEGGLMITYLGVNNLKVTDLDDMNQYFFITMHHEFAHILHQTKTYPKRFDLLSVGHYDALGWQDRNSNVVASLGFTTPYASSQPREDFAETIAQYITMSQTNWDALLENASKGWTSDGKPAATDTDGVDGRDLILQKVEIARQWLRESWGTDLDALREEVQARQDAYRAQVSTLTLLNELRRQVTDIPVPGANSNVDNN